MGGRRTVLNGGRAPELSRRWRSDVTAAEDTTSSAAHCGRRASRPSFGRTTSSPASVSPRPGCPASSAARPCPTRTAADLTRLYQPDAARRDGSGSWSRTPGQGSATPVSPAARFDARDASSGATGGTAPHACLPPRCRARELGAPPTPRSPLFGSGRLARGGDQMLRYERLLSEPQRQHLPIRARKPSAGCGSPERWPRSSTGSSQWRPPRCRGRGHPPSHLSRWPDQVSTSTTTPRSTSVRGGSSDADDPRMDAFPEAVGPAVVRGCGRGRRDCLIRKAMTRLPEVRPC